MQRPPDHAREKQRFVVVSEDERHIQWLEQYLAPEADAVIADEADARRVAQLADAASTSLLFVRVDAADARERAALIRELLVLKPNLDVVAVSDQEEKDAILAAVRAGAADFVRIGSDPRDLRDTVARIRDRRPGGRDSGQGEQVAILCARPDISTSTFAVHLALAHVQLAGSEDGNLLIDLAMPASDSLFFLDMERSYTFLDALRSVRRFDETLIQTAFGRDPSGLAVLPLPDDPTPMQDVTGNDMLALFSVLKGYFRNTVLNLGGLRSPDFVAPALAAADRILLLADQSVASCAAARKLIEGVVARGIPNDSLELVVDRFAPNLDPAPEKIAEVLGIRLRATLPPNGFVMLKAMNSAQSIFEIAPDSPYVHAVRALSAELLGQELEDEPEGVAGLLQGWLRRLRGTAAEE